jgi:uncharacterized damage-inducible protein DinB
MSFIHSDSIVAEFPLPTSCTRDSGSITRASIPQSRLLVEAIRISVVGELDCRLPTVYLEAYCERRQRMDRKSLLEYWKDVETTGLWHAPWSKALSGLTAAQAAWKPAPQRHSIWQIVNHVTFWREHEIRSLAGDKPGENEIARRNFEPPKEVSDSAWSATVARFQQSYRQMTDAIQNEAHSLDRLKFILPHDCYHMGQVMFLRALQNLPSVE